jgi:hypothetical protein
MHALPTCFSITFLSECSKLTIKLYATTLIRLAGARQVVPWNVSLERTFVLRNSPVAGRWRWMLETGTRAIRKLAGLDYIGCSLGLHAKIEMAVSADGICDLGERWARETGAVLANLWRGWVSNGVWQSGAIALIYRKTLIRLPGWLVKVRPEMKVTTTGFAVLYSK